MKFHTKLLALLIVSLPNISIFGQGSADTTRIRAGHKMIEIIEDTVSGKNKFLISQDPSAEDDDDKDTSKFTHVGAFGLDLGANLYLHDGNLNYPSNLSGLETKTLNSAHVGVHLLPTTIAFAKGHLNFLTAFDFDILQMAFQENTILAPDQDFLYWQSDSSSNLKKSKLTVTYAQIPLLFGFQTNPSNEKKNFRLSVGGFAGVRIDSKLKTKGEDGSKSKISDDYNLEKFRYGLTGRIGYRGLDFYVNYSLTPMFRTDQAPPISSISIGIGLLGGW